MSRDHLPPTTPHPVAIDRHAGGRSPATLERPAHSGPILRAEGADGGRSARDLSRRARRGELVRLGPGTYARTASWIAWPAHERYLVALVGFSQSRRRPPTFCGATALRLHGLPDIQAAPALDVLATSRGVVGWAHQPRPYSDSVAVLSHLATHRSPGWDRVSTTTLPMLPMVRRHDEGSSVSATSVMDPDGAGGSGGLVTVLLEDGTLVGRVRVVPLEQAVATVFGREPLTVGTAAADVLQGRADGKEIMERSRTLLTTAASRQRLDRQWAFADGRSESAGESLCRATIHDLGFEVPDLQHRILDRDGGFVARVDYWWAGMRLAAEFDGLMKYGGLPEQQGRSEAARQALIREKRREDAIRREVSGFARWVWADVRDLRGFARQLEALGVPRRV